MADMIRYEFTFSPDGDYPAFRDTLMIPPEEFPWPDNKINQLKQERYDNFKATIDAAKNMPPEPVSEPTAIQQALDAVNQASDALQQSKTALESVQSTGS